MSSGDLEAHVKSPRLSVILLFLLISLGFYADKLLLGPYSIVRLHDVFDSEFSRCKATGELVSRFGLFGWFPNVAGGSPSYAYHFVPYYPVCLMSVFLPLWLIYSLMVIALMLMAGYGLYRFLTDFLGLPEKVSIAGGVVFALSTQIQVNAVVGLVFNYAFPIFFIWTVALFPRSRSSAVFAILGAIGIVFFSYPVGTIPFFSLLHLLIILFLNPVHKGKDGAMLMQWAAVWVGYTLIFGPQLYALFQYSSVAAREYLPHTQGLPFYVTKFGAIIPSKSLTLFFLGGSVLLFFQSVLLRRALLMCGFFLVMSAFFASSASNFLLGSFVLKMDLVHYLWTLNFMMTIASFIGISVALSSSRSLMLFLVGGVAALLLVWGYSPGTRYDLPRYGWLLVVNVLVAVGVLFYCGRDWLVNLLKVSNSRLNSQPIWVGSLCVVMILVRADRFEVERDPYNRFFGSQEELRNVIKGKEPGRVGSLNWRPVHTAMAVTAGLETVDGRSTIFFRPYKQFFGKLVEKQFKTKEQRDSFYNYWYNLNLLNGSAAESFSETFDSGLGLNIPMLLSANVTHIISGQPVAELASISSEVFTIGREYKAVVSLPAYIMKHFQPFPVYVYALRSTFARGYLVDKARILSSDQEVLETLAGQSLSTLREIVFFSKQDGVIPEKLGTESSGGVKEVSLRYYSPDKLIFNVETESDAFLVISNNYDPKWTARIDGKHALIYRANNTFQALFIVSGGKKEVILEYKDPILWILHITIPLGVSVIFLALILVKVPGSSMTSVRNEAS